MADTIDADAVTIALEHAYAILDNVTLAVAVGNSRAAISGVERAQDVLRALVAARSNAVRASQRSSATGTADLPGPCYPWDPDELSRLVGS